jgi:hypothetical protein
MIGLALVRSKNRGTATTITFVWCVVVSLAFFVTSSREREREWDAIDIPTFGLSTISTVPPISLSLSLSFFYV